MPQQTAYRRAVATQHAGAIYFRSLQQWQNTGQQAGLLESQASILYKKTIITVNRSRVSIRATHFLGVWHTAYWADGREGVVDPVKTFLLVWSQCKMRLLCVMIIFIHHQVVEKKREKNNNNLTKLNYYNIHSTIRPRNQQNEVLQNTLSHRR